MSIFNTSKLKIKEKDPLRKTKIRALNNIKSYLQDVDKKVDNIEILEEEVLQKIFDSTRVLNELVDARDEEKVNEIKETIVKKILECSEYITRGLKLIREDMEAYKLNTASDLDRLGIYDSNVSGYYGDQLDKTGRKDWGVKLAKEIIRKEMEKKDSDNSLEFAISLCDDKNLVKDEGQKASENSSNASETSLETAISLNDEDSVKVNGSDNSSDTKVSSIFGEEDGATISDNNSSSSSDNSVGVQVSNNSGAENGNNVEEKRNEYIERVKKYLSKRGIEESELEESNRNWLEKIKTTNDLSKMFNIICGVEIDAKNKKDLKQQTAELDKIIENVSSLFEDESNVNKAFSTLNESLGEEKNETKLKEARKVMINQDPEKYFDSFIQWVKDEEKKIEEEKKKFKETKTNSEIEKETDTNSEIEYDEEEQLFLEGEINDQKKKEEIAKRIEEKINVKKKSWDLKKWWNEWWEWVVKKARLLKKKNKVNFEQKINELRREIKNTKDSSNRYTRQAYSKNQKRLNNLLSELDAISQENQNAPEKGFFRPEVVIPISLVAVVAIVAAVVIRRKRKIVKFKE